MLFRNLFAIFVACLTFSITQFELNFCQAGFRPVNETANETESIRSLKNADKPNVIIIFIDDMGWGDVGFNGATGPKTPRLDQMAKDGMRFNDFYVGCSVCTGSRTALLTGCHFHRLGMKPVLFPHDRKGLAQDEVTIADMLKENGYNTACVGKWHLGHLPPCLPTYQGFDSYYGIPYSNDMWIDPANKLADNITLREGLTLEEVKSGHKKKNWVPLMRGEEVIEYPCDQNTVTKRYTEEAVKFIELSVKAEKPFFLYLPHTMVHLPLAASKKFAGRTEKLIWDCIEEVDWSVGEILDCLKENGIEDETLVVFTSDNGAAVGSSLPLRGRKFTVYDGGVREPTLMHWAGKIPAGSVCKEVCASVDLLPTIAALTGANVPDREIDGYDITDLLMAKSGAKSPHETYCVQHSGGMVRSGKWKFYPWKEKAKGRGSAESIGQEPSPLPVQLYDVSNDIGERTNLADKYPKIVERLNSVYLDHVKELKDESREMLTMHRPENAPSAERPGGKNKEKKNGRNNKKKKDAKEKDKKIAAENVSADPTYGYSDKNPILVGSKQTYRGPTMERMYLASLEDEFGKSIKYRREGSTGGFGPRGNMLDIYEVTKSDGSKVTLFINMYHPECDPLKQPAPVGFKKRLEAGVGK